jgi:predicted TIM-barrel fold metal-dependent hydrolase
MFASDHPLLEIEKCVGDLTNLDLPTPVLEAYAAGNAERVFFSTG